MVKVKIQGLLSFRTERVFENPIEMSGTNDDWAGYLSYQLRGDVEWDWWRRSGFSIRVVDLEVAALSFDISLTNQLSKFLTEWCSIIFHTRLCKQDRFHSVIYTQMFDSFSSMISPNFHQMNLDFSCLATAFMMMSSVSPRLTLLDWLSLFGVSYF